MNLNLIGMRGVGKTNIARRVSFLTKWPVLSTDVLVSYDNGGAAIPDIVAELGWVRFRAMEADVVEKVSHLSGVIVDCGGGVVVDLDEVGNEVYSRRKVAALQAAGPVLFLSGDIPRLAAKVAGDPTRPELSATASAEELMWRRLPFYERAADEVLDVEGRDRPDIAEELAQRLLAGWTAWAPGPSARS